MSVVLILGSLASAEMLRHAAVDQDAFALLQQDFVAFNPHYKEEREPRVARTYALAKQMFDEEDA